VFEDSEVKKVATEKAEAVLKSSAIFASNTSTMPITRSGEEFKRGRRISSASISSRRSTR
jgi:3-hydroxyacyl-CoA dehydrogenase/enoyl-CoA hydratase/3-hydroxybutyryl-CoA epimerase